MTDHFNPILRFFNDANYWRKRAEEMRLLPEGMCDPEAKRKMRRLGDHYDRLARQTEEQANLQKD